MFAGQTGEGKVPPSWGLWGIPGAFQQACRQGPFPLLCCQFSFSYFQPVSSLELSGGSTPPRTHDCSQESWVSGSTWCTLCEETWRPCGHGLFLSQPHPEGEVGSLFSVPSSFIKANSC